MTEAFSAGVAYDYDPANPTAWGVLSDNARRFGLQWCTARDCGVVDCSPPMGCFAGTVANNFADKFVKCPSGGPYAGMCGQNQQACTGSVGASKKH